MELRAEVTYSVALIKRAVQRFWWRSVGWKMLAALAVSSISLGLLVHAGNRSWLVGALGTLLLICVAFVVLLYLVHYRRGIARLAAMGTPAAELVASQSTLAVKSGAGTADLQWSAIKELWRFPEVWLLLLSPGQFITLPVGQLTPAFLALVQERVESSGGRIG
jgi:hypothetical protein